MKQNTGGGCNDHNGCPNQPACDKARTKTVDCLNRSFSPVGDLHKIPVFEIPTVLAEVELQANVEAEIKLPTRAREIKWIRKNVSLKQCKAIRSQTNPNFVKVFITGVVHKNIQYVEDCSGYVKDFSTEVHFSCNQQVEVFNYVNEFPSRKASVEEIKFIDNKGHGADRCTTGSHTFEFFNEPIECKLLFAEVNELDILKDFDKYSRFKKITVKMEVLLFFKLLQTQQFDARRVTPPKPPCKSGNPVQNTVQKTPLELYLARIYGSYRIR